MDHPRYALGKYGPGRLKGFASILLDLMCRESKVALNPSQAEAIRFSQLPELMGPLCGYLSDADEQVLQSYNWNLTLAVDVLSLLSPSTLLGLIDNEVILISHSVYYIGMRVVSYDSINFLAFGGFA